MISLAASRSLMAARYSGGAVSLAPTEQAATSTSASVARITGLPLEPVPVDLVLPHLVVENAARRLEQARRLRAVAPGALERVLQDVLLERFGRLVQGQVDRRARRLGRLQRRRQVMRVQHLRVADDDGALDGVFELPDV